MLYELRISPSYIDETSSPRWRCDARVFANINHARSAAEQFPILGASKRADTIKAAIGACLADLIAQNDAVAEQINGAAGEIAATLQ